MNSDSDYIRKLPSWAGSTFVPTLHRDLSPKLDPKTHSLPQPFVVIITGASRGIGAATAKVFAQAGASGLILTARSVEALEQTEIECRQAARRSDIKISVVPADIRLESSAVNIAQTVQTEHAGRVDVLINNAGVRSTNDSARSKLAEIDSSQIEIPIQVNYLGRFYMIKHILPLMLAEGGGSTRTIVNISSIGSHVPGPLGFSISALATNRLSQRVAEAYSEQGVFCVAMHPGAVLTDPNKPGLSERLRQASKDSRYLCGGFILWLLQEKREWLNGRYLDATWDVDELEKKKDEIVEGDKLKMRLVV